MMKLQKILHISNFEILKIRKFLKLINYSNFGKVANFLNYKFLVFSELGIFGTF